MSKLQQHNQRSKDMYVLTYVVYGNGIYLYSG